MDTRWEHILVPLDMGRVSWWNERRGLASTRLLVDSFILMEPYWCLGTGSIPFWMVFNTEGSYAALRSYLSTRVFEDIYVTLFFHGVLHWIAVDGRLAPPHRARLQPQSIHRRRSDGIS